MADTPDPTAYSVALELIRAGDMVTVTETALKTLREQLDKAEPRPQRHATT